VDCIVDCIVLQYKYIVSVFTMDCESFHYILHYLTRVLLGWGQGRQPGGKPPGPATQRLSGAWVAYTISVITSIGIKNIISSFLIILFLV
jgi:hypothetical protein